MTSRTTILCSAILLTTLILIKSASSLINNGPNNLNPNNLLDSDELSTIIHSKNKLYTYLMDHFAPFPFTKPSSLDESNLGLAEMLRRDNRFKKMFNPYEDMMMVAPMTSDHYNKKDNSVYKDAFIGVRGRR